MNHIITSFPFPFKILVKGKNSTILDCGIWNDIPIIVKVSHNESKEWITECDIQCKIIPHLLNHGIKNIIETYGIISCLSPIHKKSGLQHDIVQPSTMMIQRNIKGYTLHSYVIDKAYSWDQLTNWLLQLFTLLLWFEASPYQLYHNDLHLGNIIVETETNMVYVVDFGFSECTIGPNQRTQSLPDKYRYCGTREKASLLLSGASDMYMLLHQLSYSPHQEVATIASSKKKEFMNHFSISSTIKSNWLYTLLYKNEATQNEKEREKVHHYHMNVLSTMTYSYCIQTFFPELTNWKDIIQKITECKWEPPHSFMKNCEK